MEFRVFNDVHGVIILRKLVQYDFYLSLNALK